MCVNIAAVLLQQNSLYGVVNQSWMTSFQLLSGMAHDTQNQNRTMFSSRIFNCYCRLHSFLDFSGRLIAGMTTIPTSTYSNLNGTELVLFRNGTV